MNLNTLKAKNLKNNPRNYWIKAGFHVCWMHNGYWLTTYNYSNNFNTIGQLKNEIKTILK